MRQEEITIPQSQNGATFSAIHTPFTPKPAMPNSIPQDENSEEQLNRLAAQRHLYSHAKMILGAQVTLTIPVALGFSIIASLYPSTKVFAALWGMILSITDALVLESLQRSRISTAAKVQEMFDCAVLHLPWNSLKVGSRPEPEAVIEAVDHSKANNGYRQLRDWYPRIVGQVPLPAARLICQRTNLWWDSHLRRRYANSIVGVIVFVTTVSVVVGISYGLTLEKFVLSVLAPLSPAFLWAIREQRKQLAAASSADRLKEYVANLWSRTLIGEMSDLELDTESRRLQDEIYDQRRNNPLLFDWMYALFRSRHERQAVKGAEELVNELSASQYPQV